MSALTEHDIRVELRLKSHPLTELTGDENWWRLGPLAISKRHRTFGAGYGHPLTPDTAFRAQWFDLDGKSGWAVILHADDPEEYFAGWVPPEREAEANRWVTLLNVEIKRRLDAAHT